jgi:hypothetical protein
MNKFRRIMAWSASTSILHVAVVTFDYYNDLVISSPRGFDALKSLFFGLPEMIPGYLEIVAGVQSGISWPGIAGLSISFIVIILPLHIAVHSLTRLLTHRMRNTHQ